MFDTNLPWSVHPPARGAPGRTDPPPGPRRRTRPSARHPAVPRKLRFPATLLGFVLLVGCATAEVDGDDLGPEADALSDALVGSTALEEPYRLVFRWQLREPDLRMSGRGVARVEPPYRARLDLFTEGGETVTAAALDHHALRVPPDARELVPSPTLLWGTLGVFFPEAGMTLMRGVGSSAEGVQLEYRSHEGEELRVRVENGRELRGVELLRSGRVVQEVELSDARTDRFPQEARYRHMEDTRELQLTLESVDHVEPYPDDIWSPWR